ncbi:MAG: GNAT family N-acetyltransferase [Bacteroidales bacterium]|nr:GNAT family N-acetyltransferase [Bacteroidales bacterium]HOY39263.1 GNAT family N-acetyltransferase [Bacteroidales bacterium]HQP04518.1 GNAT family N-acetyltransferase [Bacteroidales bacterium]
MNKFMYSVRNYKSDDYQDVENIWNACDMGGSVRGDTATIVERTLAGGGALLLLVASDGENETIIGTTWITNDARRLYLHHCGILPEFRGLGLSKLLVQEALLMAKRLGMQIKLEVHRNNTVAKALYAKKYFTYLGDYEVHIVRDVSKIPD